MNDGMETVFLTRAEFDSLPETPPADRKIGKRWKRCVADLREGWVLGTFIESEVPGQVGVVWKKIRVACTTDFDHRQKLVEAVSASADARASASALTDAEILERAAAIVEKDVGVKGSVQTSTESLRKRAAVLRATPPERDRFEAFELHCLKSPDFLRVCAREWFGPLAKTLERIASGLESQWSAAELAKSALDKLRARAEAQP